MNISDIKNRVQRIEDAQDDDEVAHALEDTLYQDFVEYIADFGNECEREMAKEILKTKYINFGRYC